MNVILYSTGCPKCNVLKKKLDEKGIEYTLINDKNTMINKGFTMVPMLEANEKIMNFKEAMAWVNE